MKKFSNTFQVAAFVLILFFLAILYYRMNFYKPIDLDVARFEFACISFCFDSVNLITLFFIIIKNNKNTQFISKFLFYIALIVYFILLIGDWFSSKPNTEYSLKFNNYVLSLVMYSYFLEIIFHNKVKLLNFDILNKIGYLIYPIMGILSLHYLLLFLISLSMIIFPS